MLTHTSHGCACLLQARAGLWFGTRAARCCTGSGWRTPWPRSRSWRGEAEGGEGEGQEGEGGRRGVRGEGREDGEGGRLAGARLVGGLQCAGRCCRQAPAWVWCRTGLSWRLWAVGWLLLCCAPGHITRHLSCTPCCPPPVPSLFCIELGLVRAGFYNPSCPLLSSSGVHSCARVVAWLESLAEEAQRRGGGGGAGGGGGGAGGGGGGASFQPLEALWYETKTEMRAGTGAGGGGGAGRGWRVGGQRAMSSRNLSALRFLAHHGAWTCEPSFPDTKQHAKCQPFSLVLFSYSSTNAPTTNPLSRSQGVWCRSWTRTRPRAPAARCTRATRAARSGSWGGCGSC